MKKFLVFFGCAVILMAWRTTSDNNITTNLEPVICTSTNLGVYTPIENVILSSPSLDDEVIIEINTVSEAMSYDKTSFTVKAGQKLKIIFTNMDSQQHNFLLGKIGSMNKIGAAADALAMSTNGADKSYIPDSEFIIQASPLLSEEESVEIILTVPSTPGDYPYMCTFPGHWRIMNGMMKVVAA